MSNLVLLQEKLNRERESLAFLTRSLLIPQIPHLSAEAAINLLL